MQWYQVSAMHANKVVITGEGIERFDKSNNQTGFYICAVCCQQTEKSLQQEKVRKINKTQQSTWQCCGAVASSSIMLSASSPSIQEVTFLDVCCLARLCRSCFYPNVRRCNNPHTLRNAGRNDNNDDDNNNSGGSEHDAVSEHDAYLAVVLHFSMLMWWWWWSLLTKILLFLYVCLIRIFALSLLIIFCYPHLSPLVQRRCCTGGYK